MKRVQFAWRWRNRKLALEDEVARTWISPEALMPRYFIDTNDDDVFVEDDKGHNLPDAEAAREAAQAALPDMARDKMPDGEGRTFCACVRDDAGVVIYKVTLTLRGEWKKEGAVSQEPCG